LASGSVDAAEKGSAMRPGDRLGPYEIVALIGAGGMGEVYKARDTRLDRTVAIKILPPELAGDPDRRARFEREARAISQLTHPHICALYDIGETVPSALRPTPAAESPAPGLQSLAPGPYSVSYLVMEYLEGETLAARLGKGPLPLTEVLRLGGEIASALDTAHRHGIVHRDLKPANVMLAKGGAARSGAPLAKLTDFGLARPMALASSALGQTESPTDLPTVRRPLTAEGTIVGTLQYMAPEQLEGKEADARTDLWALGCVLYEMATGKQAFAGTSQASLIAAILKEAPRPLAELQPLTPPALERVVSQCLEKNPDERWQSAHDIASELEWISGADAGSLPSAASAKLVTRRRERLAWVLASAMALVALAAGAVALVAPRWTPRQPEAALMRFSVTAPAGGALLPDATSAAISPDGERLVFTVVEQTGVPRLWIRPLDTLAAQPLPGTENALFPFWSPDSRHVAFFAEGQLWRIPVGGGSREAICEAPTGRGGTWSKDGVIVFAPAVMGPLKRVSSDGGQAVDVERPDTARGETGLRFPSFLPDGKHFLYVSLPKKQEEEVDVYVGSLDSSESKRIMSAGSAPIYAEPGFLLFDRRNRLVAQRFDMATLMPAGDVVALGDISPLTNSDGASLLSASANGVLARVSTMLPETQLVWFDRAGRTLDTVPLPPASYASPSLSPDGRRAIVTKANSPTSYDLWLVDLERAVPRRLTSDGLVASVDATGVWSPDGRRAAYMYNRSGVYDVYQVPTAGEGRPEPLVQSNMIFKTPAAWSPDGKYLVFSQNEATEWDLWLQPLKGDRKPVRYLRSPFNEYNAAISPDGRWLAFDSDETGTSEIYVSSFPEPGEKYRVSTSGGTHAQWSGSGKELIIWSTADVQAFSRGSVFSVDVQTTPTFKAGQPRVLFTPRGDIMGLTATSDLKRFLAAVPVEGASPASITVILNWQAALKKSKGAAGGRISEY
jgi:serine/threonine protein kinase/Tol biopolymer transport system component